MPEEAVMERVVDGSEGTVTPPPDPVTSYNAAFDNASKALDDAFSPKTDAVQAEIPAAPVAETPQTEQPPQVETPVESAPEQPEAVTPEPVAPPPPESVLSGFFDLWQVEDPQARTNAAVEQAMRFAESDWPTFEAMFNGMYHTARGVVRDWVLQDEGIPAEKIGQFNEWIASGAPALVAPESYPAFPVPDANPQSDTYGMVRLFDGTELDTNDPIHKKIYDQEKRLYEGEIEAKKGEVRQAEEAKQAEQAQQVELQSAQYQALATVDEVYTAGRYQVVSDMLAPLLSSLQTDDDKFSGELLESHIYRSILNPTHPVGKQVAQIGQQASKWLNETVPGMVARMRQGGQSEEQIKTALTQLTTSGRMLGWSTEQDRIIRNHVNAMKDRFVRNVLNRTKAVNPTAPQVETKPVDVVTPLPSDEQPPKNREEWMNYHSSRAAAALDNLIR